MNVPRALAALLLAVPLLASCGAGPTLPATGPCPSPTAVPARPGNRAQPGESEYRQALFAGIDQLTKLTADFKKHWPGTGFSRDSSFRPDFAKYADSSTCVAQGMLSEVPPTGADPAFVEAFSSAVHDVMDAEARARDGVKARNVTVYQDWVSNIDGLINAIRDTFRQFPQAPFEPPARRTPTN